MPRSTRTAAPVNHLSFKELQEVLGPSFEEAFKLGIEQYFANIGRAVAEALIHNEVEALCGPKNQRQRDRAAVRWGSQPGFITVRGVKEPIEKPRVRTADGKHEIDLETYAAASKKPLLRDEAMLRIGSGISTRQFGQTIRKELQHSGLSKTAVSRRVVEATKLTLDAFQQRRWDTSKFVAILIDGVRIGGALVIASIGVDKSGCKHVLGWNVGSTENATACRDLLRKLADAGLNLDRNYLFVLDGSKALKSAVQERFGVTACIQRCQEHKIRDVEDYLPVHQRKRFRVLLQAAYNEKSYRVASERLQRIRSRLMTVSERAGNALTEGLEETLTLHRLGITGGVRQSLRTTNIIESAFSRMRTHTRNVTNWTEISQVERWLAFSLTKVEKGFRQLPGYRQLSKLERLLQAALQSPNA